MDKLFETPIKAMRKMCLQCTVNQPKEIRLCTIIDCACYAYRMGTRPSKATLDTMEAFYEENPEYSGGFQTKTANPKDTEDK
jgi:hypothetical protein